MYRLTWAEIGDFQQASVAVRPGTLEAMECILSGLDADETDGILAYAGPRSYTFNESWRAIALARFWLRKTGRIPDRV